MQKIIKDSNEFMITANDKVHQIKNRDTRGLYPHGERRSFQDNKIQSGYFYHKIILYT